MKHWTPGWSLSSLAHVQGPSQSGSHPPLQPQLLVAATISSPGLGDIGPLLMSLPCQQPAVLGRPLFILYPLKTPFTSYLLDSCGVRASLIELRGHFTEASLMILAVCCEFFLHLSSYWTSDSLRVGSLDSEGCSSKLLRHPALTQVPGNPEKQVKLGFASSGCTAMEGSSS